MPGYRQYRAPGTEPRGGPSAMARASDRLPPRPYRYRGEPEPPAVLAARERWRALNAEPDIEPGFEWYRELADEAPDGDGLAELEAARDRYQAAVPGPDAPAPPPAPAPPVTPASRCGRCGYLTTAPGHAIQCGGSRS